MSSLDVVHWISVGYRQQLTKPYKLDPWLSEPRLRELLEMGNIEFPAPILKFDRVFRRRKLGPLG